MKILGITAEYNPFHNGHKYHVEKSKELSGSDYVVAVMSGNFTQRGEAAVLDKWDRSRLAIENGVDLVLELPFVFACARGEIFASGAVDILAGIGATHISFGSESGELDRLQKLVNDMAIHQDEINEIRTNFMNLGDSYVKSLQYAVERVLGKAAASLMLAPNNILAIEYLKRIKSKGYGIKPVAVTRHGSGYFDENENSGFAGATVIRDMFSSENGKGAVKYVPENVYSMLTDNYLPEDKRSERMFQLIRAEIVRSSSEELSEIYCVGEGLENKLKKEIIKAKTLDELISSVVSKRYTEAAIRRIMTYLLMRVREHEPSKLLYARVLAANEKGREIIRRIKKQESSDVPVITNINKETDVCNSVYDTLKYDLLASDVYNLINGRDLYDFSDRVMRPYIR